MSTAALEQACASTRRILANVTPDQYELPTPCESWDVRALVNHMIGASHFFAASMDAGETPPPVERDFTVGDVLAAYDEGIQASVAAFGAPGAAEKVVKLPFGEFTGAMVMGLSTNEQFTHGWDLAKATGQPTDIEPELAAQLLEQTKAAIPDEYRGPDGQAPFGVAVDLPDSAPAADRLAGFLGRQV